LFWLHSLCKKVMLNMMENSKKPTILVIEDEPAMLTLLTHRLSESGFELLTANNGQDGLNLALQNHPQLIILDILMPKVDGMTLMKKLREDSWGKTVPLIVLSNLSPDNNTQLEAIQANQPAYYFIKSNIQLDEIVTKIQELLASPQKNEAQ
jgi:two-component system, OmpR family, alkaline phosphatase synthesis response regulator PhoP